MATLPPPTTMVRPSSANAAPAVQLGLGNPAQEVRTAVVGARRALTGDARQAPGLAANGHIERSEALRAQIRKRSRRGPTSTP